MRILLLLQIVPAVGAVCGIGFYLLCIWSSRPYLRHNTSSADFLGDGNAALPGVSILKPLRGTDPHIYECFRSHCLQEYGEYELIFGVDEPTDPVIDEVLRLQREFPN